MAERGKTRRANGLRHELAAYDLGAVAGCARRERRAPAKLRLCRMIQFERDTRAESGHFDGR